MKTLAWLLIVIFSLAGCSSSTHERAPVADVTAKQSSYVKTQSKQSTQAITGKTYKVQKGDTLYSIAWRGNLDINRLAQYNNLSSPYVIRKGQTLNLVAVNKPVAKATTTAKPQTSQKTAKTASTTCTGQSCNKKAEQTVVEQKPKEYPATSNKTKAAKKEPVATPKQEYTNTKVSKWLWPADGRLTKTFSASQAGMKGISISNQRDTAVKAAAPGKVVYAGSGLRGFGHLVIIKHNDDYLSAYAHNEKLLIKENDTIKIGQKIALMGDSGTDTVKLHFEIRYRGQSVDPLRYLPKR